MNILVAFDNGYAIPTKVMLKSLISNNPVTMDIYVLYIELSDSNIASIMELESETVVFHFKKIDASLLDVFPLTLYYTKEANIRLFANELLDRGLERILWLDGDIIVKGSIVDFYSQDFEEKCFIAMPDMELHDDLQTHERLGMNPDNPYINSGVLLIDLVEMRRQIKKEDIVCYVRENAENLKYVDQDVLNTLLYDKIKVVNTEKIYNCFSTHICSYFSNLFCRKSRIVHYVLEKKPWKEGYCFGAFALWWRYSLMIPDTVINSKYKTIKKTRKRLTPHNIVVLLNIMLPNIKNSGMYAKLKAFVYRKKKA